MALAEKVEPVLTAGKEGDPFVVTEGTWQSFARSALRSVCDRSHITEEQFAILVDSLRSLRPADFVSRMTTEGVKGTTLALALSEVLRWPLYSAGSTQPRTKTESFLIGDDGYCYIINPLDVQGHNSISDLLYGIDVKGWGIIPQIVLQETEGEIHRVITNPDRSKEFIHNLVFECYNKGGSDIHFQPRGSEVLVRMRIDGALRNHQSLDVNGFWDIAGTLMTECKLNSGEYLRPFDGRFLVHPAPHIRIPIRLAGVEASTAGVKIPKFTLRLLSSKQELVDLDTLGFSKTAENPQFRNITEAFRKPYGMIIVTGPTGSGKSTTLFAAMRWMMSRRPTDAFVTLEDPVEAELPGAVQIQCVTEEAAGPTFATALRNVLRQDPDTILVGEMRDQETADLGVKAAITGHRLLTTLHANSAPGAATRLRDMGVDPTLMSDAITMLTAQRIIPSVCPKCARRAKWGQLVSNLSHPAFEGHSTDVRERFRDAPFRYRHLTHYPSDDHTVSIHSPKGCEACDNRGTKGRTLIAEVLMMTSELKSLVAKPNTTESDILMLALQQGFKPMWEHAFEAIHAGKVGLLNAEEGLGPLPYVVPNSVTELPALPTGPGNAVT